MWFVLVGHTSSLLPLFKCYLTSAGMHLYACLSAQLYMCFNFKQSLLKILNDFLYILQVDGMDVLAVKQACKFAKEHALKNGPLVSTFFCCYGYLDFFI